MRQKMRGMISSAKRLVAIGAMVAMFAGVTMSMPQAGAGTSESEAAALMRAGADAIEHGQYQKAVADFSNALDSGGLAPEGRALAYHYRGVAFQKIGEQDAAIADYTRAIEARSLSGDVLARTHYNRGISYGRTGQEQAAERDYLKAIELSPRYAAAHHNLANLLRQRGQLDDAISHYSAAIDEMRGRDRRLPLYGRALSFEQKGDVARASADLRQALAVDPEFEQASARLAELEAGAGGEVVTTTKVLPSTIMPFQAASSGHEGAQIIRISSIGGWRTTATRFPQEEAPVAMADAASANDEIITGSLRPSDDIPSAPVAAPSQPLTLAKAEAKPAPAAAAAARYRVQLGAFREEALALRAWDEVSSTALPVLGGTGHAIQRADLGDKGVFYRLQAGAFSKIGDAKSACKALEQRKIACFVVESPDLT
jgi:Tfp pilus assembly protein PilF